ncbi:MAG TPA: PBP1A family penicillin-binding protein [Gemmatimonadales bacterium]|nr:PBP1A family penicillin-binding protein [Gemmatimonadales bacterium]
MTRWGRRILTVTGIAATSGALLTGTAALAWAHRLYRDACAEPCVDLSVLRRFAPSQTSYVYDVRGVEIGQFRVENRRVARLDEIPRRVREAFLAIEDARFYEHDGVDPRRIVGALVANLRSGETEQGASTITMQLARNTYPAMLPARERTFARKLREVRVAREIEQAFPKDTILHRYLNTIYLGSGAYGVAAAARTYFDSDIHALSVAQAALLAGLPRAPSVINPYLHPDAARARRNLVLDRMHRLGWLDSLAWESARAEPLSLARESPADTLESAAVVGAYFLEAVRLELQRELGPAIYRGGYRIHTTLDNRLQRMAEVVLESQLVALEAGALGAAPRPARLTRRSGAARATTDYLQAGLVILDPDSGDVRVLIGGRSFRDSPFNRMTQARRQPGSSFKPFVYAAALAAGQRPADLVSDAPVAIVMPAGNVWRPQNFKRDEANGLVTLETALARSLNRATVRLGMSLGVSRVAAAARAMGLVEPLPLRPSMLLGAADLRPIDLISAYAPLARADGRSVVPRLVVRIEDPEGNVLPRPAPGSGEGLGPGVAAELRTMLEQVIERGTARSVRQHGYGGLVAGKTGTTNGTFNAWFIGVTPDYVAGVWVGFDRPRPILPDGSATGGRIAAPIWAEVMKRIPAGRSAWPASPESVPDLSESLVVQ